MRVPKPLVQERIDHFLDACRRQGVKMTHQRLEIYRELASTEEHPDAIMVHRRIRRRLPLVSIDTVYRNLRLLESHGLIAIVGMSHERLRFDANMSPHHHFVCVSCSKIRDFTTSEGRHESWPEEARAFGKPLSLRVEVRGLCRECQRAGHNRNSSRRTATR